MGVWQGACGTCPSSTVTLRHGIERGGLFLFLFSHHLHHCTTPRWLCRVVLGCEGLGFRVEGQGLSQLTMRRAALREAFGDRLGEVRQVQEQAPAILTQQLVGEHTPNLATEALSTHPSAILF